MDFTSHNFSALTYCPTFLRLSPTLLAICIFVGRCPSFRSKNKNVFKTSSSFLVTSFHFFRCLGFCLTLPVSVTDTGEVRIFSIENEGVSASFGAGTLDAPVRFFWSDSFLRRFPKLEARSWSLVNGSLRLTPILGIRCVVAAIAATC